MKRRIQLLLLLLSLSTYIGCATSQEDDAFNEDEEEIVEEELPERSSKGRDSRSNDEDLSLEDEEVDFEESKPGDLKSEDELLVDNSSSDEFNSNPPDSSSKSSSDTSDPLLEEDLSMNQNSKTSDELNSSELNDSSVANSSNSFEEELSSTSKNKSESLSESSSGEDTGLKDSTMASSGAAKINNIRFESGDGASTVVIESNTQLTYNTRFNPQTQQFIVELSGVNLPESLKRPYTTKDFKGDVGSVDAYQTPGSDTAKVVVQMREGASEPTVQQEGTKILVIAGSGSGTGAGGEVSSINNEDYDFSNGPDSNDNGVSSIDGGKGILSSANLQEFLSSNMKFFGKKISLEVKDISVRDAINLIAEESGANLVMTDSVNGNLSLKLRKVPWDQALVMILKTKKLGYTRQGNVLRITDMSEIKQEEDEAMRIAESKRKVEPLVVQMIPINYAKIDDLRAQISSILSDRGKVIADSRTSAMIITDTADVLDRVKKMISSLDIPPAQILIEGKIVEANESFEKSLGIKWGAGGQDHFLMNGDKGPVNLTPNISVQPGLNPGASLGVGLKIGNLNLLGDLDSMIALEEREDNVKVISSPRIMTLHNVKASIEQGSQIPIIVGGGMQLNGNVQSRTRDVVYKNLQMHLNVTPQVANNGNVIMNVDVKRDFPGAVSDPESGAAPIYSRQAQTTVMVKSGQTAVIGGIYQNDARNGEGGVPVLKDIPILGYLFRSENQSKNKTELLLFLTPRVLKSAERDTLSDNKTIKNMEME